MVESSASGFPNLNRFDWLYFGCIQDLGQTYPPIDTPTFGIGYQVHN